VRQPSGHAVTGDALASAAPAPLVRIDDPAGQHRTVRFQPLSHGLQAELLQPAERGQVRAGEARIRGSVSHVEVFRMRRVGTFILGRPRPLSAHRRADRPAPPPYTLIWDEPVIPHARRQPGTTAPGAAARRPPWRHRL